MPPTTSERPANAPTDPEALPAIITIRPWVDPLVDDRGYDPRSRYVETFWLGVLGPTATWLLRRLAAGLEREPEGYRLDLSAVAKTMGLAYDPARPTSPFSKALQRCVMFGVAQAIPHGLAVRRRVPPIAARHLRRLPDSVRQEHATWETHTVSLDELTRAHRLATTLTECGDDINTIEHRLIALGVTAPTAATVAENALRLAADAG